MHISITDEHCGNPFPRELSLVDSLGQAFHYASPEGYSHNWGAIKRAVRQLSEIIGIPCGARTLDIGYGQNLTVAATLQGLGMSAYGLDSVNDVPPSKKGTRPFFLPPQFHRNHGGVQLYYGTIEELLHEDSQLKDTKFDLMTFWGSWESGGNNFTIGGEMGWFRAVEELERAGTPFEIYGPLPLAKMRETREKVLRDCASALRSKGGILIVSSRYAGHGAGFSTDQLPYEKRINLMLAQSFATLGAQHIRFFGVSKEEVERQLAPYTMLRDISAKLSDDDTLFVEGEIGKNEAYPSVEQIAAMRSMHVPLGRIDALYAQF